MNARWIALKALKVATAIVVIVGIVGWVVMSLWNALLPQLFGWPVLGYWQAVGLLVLARVLFGGRGFHGGHRWRAGMRRRWDKMTPEERERFRAGMKSRWCRHDR